MLERVSYEMTRNVAMLSLHVHLLICCVGNISLLKF